MKQKNLLFRIFLVIFLVAVAGIIGLLVRDHIQKDKDRKLRDKAAVSVQEEPEVSAEPEEILSVCAELIWMNMMK